MNSSLMMTLCPTEDKKLYSPSLPIPRHLLQNPAYTVAIPALLELQSGRTFSTGSEEKTIKLEVTQKPVIPGSQSNRNSLAETAAFERYSEIKSDFSPMTTLLNYHPITAFNVGGELRLCLPQVMNSALKKYSLQQIEQKINELNIYISRCSTEQAKCLKMIKVLPERVPYCGLITKSNAERLVYELLEKDEDIIRENEDDRKRLKANSDSPNKLFGFRVYHECFGKCKGTLYPVLFTEPEAKCIECLECTFMFSPNKFVCHAHRGHESIGICHWGFDSANWRSYLQISKDQENSKELDGHLEQMKSKTFDAADLIANAAKRKYESGNMEKVLITQIVSGQTPGKKFPRVECDSGFGSSPDSNSNGSSGLSPPVITSVSCQNALVSTSVSLNRPSVSSKSIPYPSTSPASATSEPSSLPGVGVTSSTVHHLKSSSEAFSSSSLTQNLHDKLSNPSGSSGQVHFARCQGPQLTVIKPGDKIQAALFSPHLTFPQINGQQDLQHQLIAIERPPTVPNPTNSHSTGSAAAAAAAIQQISQQQQQPQAPQPSSFQRPSIVSNPTTAHHSNQIAPPPIVIAAAAAAAQPQSAPSSLHHVTAPSLTVAAAAAAASGTPTVTMPTDWVSPELRMISQAMEVSIAKISAHCTPTVKIHLDQLVELLKEQQKQYLKDFAMTHQDNERLVVELKSREREINESKIALSRLRQQLERTELEVQKEKDLRLRTNVDLAQILRQQAAIGAYSSSLVQAQQQQLQSVAAAASEKEGILVAAKRPKFLHVEVDDDEVSSQKKVLKIECKTSPTSPSTESTECSPLREIACSKRGEESDDDHAPSSSSSSSSSATATAVPRYSSSSHVAPRKSSAVSSPTVIVTVRATSRESISPLAPLPSSNKGEDSSEVSVKSQSTLSSGRVTTPTDPRSTPSPSYSNESSSTLVIVDS